MKKILLLLFVLCGCFLGLRGQNSCQSPNNLTATLHTPNWQNVLLNWAAPTDSTSLSLSWATTYATRIGMDAAADFTGVIRFDVTDLANYTGRYLTAVSFVPGEAQTTICEYYIKVWQGGTYSSTTCNPGTLLTEQHITSPLTQYAVNTIMLDTALAIDPTQELWIGIRCVTLSGHPLGASDNGVVAGKGELLNMDTTWETLTSSNLTDYNWLIVGTLTEESHLVSGYNVYKDNNLQNTSPIAANTYSDSVANGTYVYGVAAQYLSGCESAPVTVTVDMHDNPCINCLDSSIVGTGTTGSCYLPLCTYYRNSYSQQIYTSSEFDSIPGTIPCIAFQYIYNTPQTKGPVQIYMGNTSKTSFSNSTDWVALNDMNLVFSGSIIFDNTGTNNNWVNIPLDRPFEWDGESNIVIAIINNTGAYESSNDNTFNVHSAASKSLYAQSDTYAYDPILSNYSGTVGTIRNNIRFMVGEPPLCPMPTHFTVSNITHESADLHWQPRGNAGSYEIVVVSEYSDFNSETPITVNDTAYNLPNLTPNTDYTIYLRSNCNPDYSSWFTRTIHTHCLPVSILPYEENFDTYSSGSNSFPDCWTKKSTAFNYPQINNGHANSGANALYFYSNSTTYSCAVLPMIDPIYAMNTLRLKFKAYKTASYYGNLQIGVMTDPTDINTFTLIKTIDANMFSGTNTWCTFNAYFNNYTGSGQYIAILAPSNYSNYVYVDDILVNTMTGCGVPTNLEITDISGSSANISWLPSEYSDGTETYYLEYSVSGSENWQSVNTTNTGILLSSLDQVTAYDLRLYSTCADGYSDTLIGSFSTICAAGGNVTVGNGSMTSNLLPTNGCYNYSYSQQLFLASELNGPSNYYSVSFYLATPASNNMRNISIYLGNTSQSALTTSTFIPASNQHLVYSGSYNFQVGWNAIALDSTFQYTGNNLVLTVDDNTGSYSCSPYFQTHSGTTSLYYYSDGTNTNPESPSSLYSNSYRNNIKLGGNCDSTVTCPVPNLVVSNITPISADLQWAPGSQETTWELDYHATSDTVWTSAGTQTSMSYTLPMLTPGTDYEARLRAICNPGEYSLYVTLPFSTPCVYIDTLPFTENFDAITGTGSSVYPDCWSRFSTYYSSITYPYIANDHFASSPHALYFNNGGSANYTLAVLPRFDDSIAMDSLLISFSTYFNATSYHLELGIMTDPTNISTFTSLLNTHTATIDTWETHEYITRNYTGTGHYIAFRVPIGSQSLAFIDDITIQYIPNCPHINQLTATALDSTHVTLSWTAGGSEAAWEVAILPYGPVNLDTCIINYTTEMSYSESNLTPASHYTAYVRANCDDENSTWVSYDFWTTQVPAQLPYYCDFEAANPGWGFANGSLINQWWIGTATNNGGTHALYISNDQGVSNAYLTNQTTTVWAYRDIYFPVCPNGYQFSFDWKNYGEGSYDYLRVYLGDVVNPVAGSTLIEPAGATRLNSSSTMSMQSTFTTYSTTLPSTYGGGIRRLYFLWHNDSSVGTIPPAAIDNLTIAVVTCPIPTDVSASSITATGATISWTETGNATSWNLEYKLASSSTWIPITASATSYPLSSLQQNSTYQVRITADCGTGEFSPYSMPITFTTLATCPTPTNLHCTENTSSSITLSWTAGGSETSWTVAYKDQNTSDWNTAITVSTGTNPYTITGVNSSTTYDIRIKANCSASDESDWTETITVTPGSINMPVSGSTTITSCGITIYDDGGILNNYSDDCSGTLVINPETAGSRVVISGTYDTEEDWDLLSIYDGTSTSGTLLNTYTGTGNIVDTSSNGSLTLHFYSDDSNSETGFVITVSCIEAAPAECPAPTNLHLTDTTTTSATLAWDQETGTASSWIVNYKRTNEETWTTTTVSTNSYTIVNLTANTSYQAQVQAVCGEGNSSPFTPTYTFQTSNVGIDDYFFSQNISLYPNPTSSGIEISSSNTILSINEIVIYDIYGKTLKVMSVDNNNKASINIENLASGMYFVRINGENLRTGHSISTIKSFIKK